MYINLGPLNSQMSRSAATRNHSKKILVCAKIAIFCLGGF